MSYIAVGSPIVRTNIKFYTEFGVLLSLTRTLILSVHDVFSLPVGHCLCIFSSYQKSPSFMQVVNS